MKIGILGSGLMGGKLGKHWADAGHDVLFSYSRSDSKLERLAKDCGGKHGSVSEAVGHGDVLLLAVHWSRVEDVLEQAGPLNGKVVLNCCVPLDTSDRDLVVGTTSSGAEELARMRPKTRWVSCFNTTPSESFAPVYARKGQDPVPQVLTYADDDGAKQIAGGLIRDIGFEPLDCGGLRNGRYVEPFAMATVELAYVQPGGPALTYRFDKLR
ncbi:MAG: transmembrane reductase oxidoreductase [Pelagibaca sp.]|uniref:NADPH-dependent F420 reductase n=1 Tax=Salipiger bermudensis TaxID=344736 RepID=UPI000C9953EA|nr:NAD(P)-binding domain-containing protein [Salipiger bermudensis]MAE88203.1 transmembrane reductase oxidoreductase [Pelagibaca sp.]MCA1287095.1 NAD(P)-binding domain-containing protein [Salipiger bermudensis]